MRPLFDSSNAIAILVGTSSYEDFTDIPPIENNLIDLKNALLTIEAFDSCSEERIFIIDNQDQVETQDKIIQILENPDFIDTETLLFYYVGHGYRKMGKSSLSLASSKSKRRIRSSFIQFDDVKEEIEKSHFQKRLIILDACHSGLAAMSNTDGTLSDEEMTFEDGVHSIEVKGTYVMTSCAGSEFSHFDKDYRNTFFTGFFIQTINSGFDSEEEFIEMDKIFTKIANEHFKVKLPQPQRKSTFPVVFIPFCRNKDYAKKVINQYKLEIERKELEKKLWRVQQQIERPLSYENYLQRHPVPIAFDRRVLILNDDHHLFSQQLFENISALLEEFNNSTALIFPREGTYAISIGNEYSALAEFNGGYCLYFEEGGMLKPVTLAIVDNMIKCGRPAERQSITNPSGTIGSITKLLGKNAEACKKQSPTCNFFEVDGKVHMRIGSSEYSIIDLFDEFIKELELSFERYSGNRYDRVILTLPSEVANINLKLLKDRWRNRFEKVAIVDDITVIAKFLEQENRGETREEYRSIYLHIEYQEITIYALEFYENQNHILKKVSVSNSGKREFENLFIQFMSYKFLEENGTGLMDDPMSMARAREAASKTIEELFLAERTEVNLPYIKSVKGVPKHLTFVIDRTKLNSIIIEEVNRILDSCDNLVQSLNLKINDFWRFYQIGNGVKIPLIRQQIKNRYGIDAIIENNAQLICARGALRIREDLVAKEKARVLKDLCTKLFEQNRIDKFTPNQQEAISYYTEKLGHDIAYNQTNLSVTTKDLLDFLSSLESPLLPQVRYDYPCFSVP